MDKMKGFSVLLITAITAVSLVPCGKDTSSEVSSVTNAKASAWDNLNDKEKDFYKGLEEKGHTIDKDTGYVYIDAQGFKTIGEIHFEMRVL